MDFRHLRYFLAIAERGSVREAAEAVHISQPALSRQLQDLEDELGATLFTRSARGVSLTPIGEAFLVHARQILATAQASKDQVRRMAAGLEGRLCLGFVENATWDGRLPMAFRQFKESAPDVDLDLVPLNSPEQLDRLEAGTLDGALIYPFGDLPAHWHRRLLVTYDVVVALPNSWQFPSGPPRSLRQLQDRDFIVFPRHVYPAYYDRLMGQCHALGTPLRSIQSAATESAILSLVSSGMGAAIVNSANRYRPPALVDFVALEDLSIPLPLTFVRRAADPNPVLRRFEQVLEAVFPLSS
ncbi:LysR family transcriptional regulator [Caldimonas thermodepolymerans]|jgi:Transcriptional regulator|uniref:LysR family transcriptional regulator n=1 Tax=Caldimonas thermodepolymerans TaxID=215580 RepID=UPI0024903383|nr:LysR family transcriptional regulator [Caldimonas thermodepolymerans]